MQMLDSGEKFPTQSVARLGGGMIELGSPSDGHDWQMVVVYRGLHCPLCKTYLAMLEQLAPRYHRNGIRPVALSGDSEEKAQAFADEVGLRIPLGYDLSVSQMQALGLYISTPKDAQETDRPFPEPGLFVINETGHLYLVDVSNAPFSRPDLAALASGLEFVRANAYPIRGTWVA